MALLPENERHKYQIEAGQEGRNKGHKFEELVTDEINKIDFDFFELTGEAKKPHIYEGNPAQALMSYIISDKKRKIKRVKAYWLGGLATAYQGAKQFNRKGNKITGSKSDILMDVTYDSGDTEQIGVSVKSCSNNAQMELTTAAAFCTLLRDHGINVSEHAETGMKMFCGESGYRPLDDYKPYDDSNIPKKRTARPERWYWEELPTDAQAEWETIFNENQLKITMLLLQNARAYRKDRYKPAYILHECKPHENIEECEMAIMSVEELAKYSMMFDKFGLKSKKIWKGSYAKTDLTIHQYPHFGFIQFQPIGNKQNFSELQFNLKAKYYNQFKKLLEKQKNK